MILQIDFAFRKNSRKNNVVFASKEHHNADETTMTSRVQTVSFIAVESVFSKKDFSSFLNTNIMCLKIDNYTMQKSLSKRSSSRRSEIATFSLTTRRCNVNVLQMISSQEINNALTIFRYKSSEKKSRKCSRQLNVNITTTTSTQNEEL